MVCGSVKLYSMREVVEVLAALRLGLGPHSCPVLGGAVQVQPRPGKGPRTLSLFMATALPEKAQLLSVT